MSSYTQHQQYSFVHQVYSPQHRTQSPATHTDPAKQSPPPTYLSCTNQPAMAGNQGLAQPGEHQRTTSRKFMIRRRGFWKPWLEIMSPDGITPLYIKRQTVSAAAAPDIVLGRVRFHCFSSRIDVQVRNSSFTLRPRKWYGSGWYYASPAWNGATLWWKHKSHFSRQIFCLYEGEVFVARFGPGHGGSKNIAEVEVDEAAMQRAPGGETAVIEEAIMVGLAWIELRERNSQSSYTSAGGDSSSCS